MPQGLLCRARGRLCALPLAHVAEAMRPLPVEPVAGAPAFVLGLARIRGAATPVVDLGALLGAPGEPAATRFLTLRLGGRAAALAVEEVLGVRELGAASGPLPPLLAGAPAEAVAEVGALDGELLFVLEAGSLVPEAPAS
jgi:purine-binding chemotaxis protein CheW